MNMSGEDNVFIADILVVDDKLENIRFLSDFLAKQNYQVRKAINGRLALTAAKKIPPDLILLDISMPEMGGYEVCEQLKKDHRTRSIPIIFLSASNEITDKTRAFQAGGIDYITKPFHLEEVLARIQTQLALQNLQKQLQSRNEQLQSMLLALQNTQVELVQKEKLINAGRIVAGISHEINNPLSFILCNLEPASEYSQKLIHLIQLYQDKFPNLSPEIENFSEEIELDFLISDFPKVIDSIHTGADRICSVVRALHTFSRLDESGIKTIDVIESIESVLTILRYQLTVRDKPIQIFLKSEELPLFSGHASLFNQALLNLLQNAIDSLKLKINSTTDGIFKPTIWITTNVTACERIRISIKDNGGGVSKKDEEHLFEPFFTTKPVGQGVGLGLFTSYQIVNKLHKGELIYCACAEGGTEFVIEIPLEVSS